MIKVVVVDDSALMRRVLTTLIEEDGDIAVVGVARDPLEARETIKAHDPDVVTLDIEMPNMNGLEFLEKIMRLRPMPVVMVSSLTTRSARETMVALELGAVDFIAKPAGAGPGDREAMGQTLRQKIRDGARTDVSSRALARTRAQPRAPLNLKAPCPPGTLIALGASTGGVDAIRRVLEGLPADSPPVVIAQHMPAGFTTRFAARLDELVELTVHEAEDRMALLPGHAYVAPGDRHLLVERSSGALKCRVAGGELRSGHRPSVDILFASVAEVVGALAAGAILTGMGRDGAEGLGRMRAAGAYTVGQAQGSALIYGMPRAAAEIGAVAIEAPIEEIAGLLISGLLGRREAGGHGDRQAARMAAGQGARRGEG
ncbi:protein-glutamate methylesterase/protein-glutamine glutaminase [Pelagibacterium montanilacus]|uniref:protein-glutamate methylesterase/protein-glutamine glutaminase n=1 Tax=Pelagibacterium montanilacus TaxID=2185280 RepID=UPI000F8D72F1|nr:chemotaxis response regulator protein-glutamate methylesterase [Pelagibacterium montanilacus]